MTLLLRVSKLISVSDVQWQILWLRRQWWRRLKIMSMGDISNCLWSTFWATKWVVWTVSKTLCVHGTILASAGHGLLAQAYGHSFWHPILRRSMASADSIWQENTVWICKRRVSGETERCISVSACFYSIHQLGLHRPIGESWYSFSINFVDCTVELYATFWDIGLHAGPRNLIKACKRVLKWEWQVCCPLCTLSEWSYNLRFLHRQNLRGSDSLKEVLSFTYLKYYRVISIAHTLKISL